MFVLLDITKEKPIDKVTPLGVLVGTVWEFDTADDARMAAVKYGYHEVMYGWYLLDNEKDRRYKPSVLKLQDLGGLSEKETISEPWSGEKADQH